MSKLENLKLYSIDKDGDAFICAEALPEFQSAIETAFELLEQLRDVSMYVFVFAVFGGTFSKARLTTIDTLIAKATGEE